MQTCKGKKLVNIQHSVANDANIPRRKSFKHPTAQNLQTYKGAKHANMQRQKTCKHSKS